MFTDSHVPSHLSSLIKMTEPPIVATKLYPISNNSGSGPHVDSGSSFKGGQNSAGFASAFLLRVVAFAL